MLQKPSRGRGKGLIVAGVNAATAKICDDQADFVVRKILRQGFLDRRESFQAKLGGGRFNFLLLVCRNPAESKSKSPRSTRSETMLTMVESLRPRITAISSSVLPSSINRIVSSLGAIFLPRRLWRALPH